MKSILVLASDFLERMSNPAYGARLNEEYALRFAQLLEGERGELESRLGSEIRLLDDPEALTPHAWLWLISWARAKGVALDPKLALDLFSRWSSTALRAAIVEVATQSWEGDRRTAEPTIVEFPDRWLHSLLVRVVSPPPVCSQNSSATSDELIAAVEAAGQAASCQTYRW